VPQPRSGRRVGAKANGAPTRPSGGSAERGFDLCAQPDRAMVHAARGEAPDTRRVEPGENRAACGLVPNSVAMVRSVRKRRWNAAMSSGLM
jgi:hypothetical protein